MRRKYHLSILAFCKWILKLRYKGFTLRYLAQVSRNISGAGVRHFIEKSTTFCNKIIEGNFAIKHLTLVQIILHPKFSLLSETYLLAMMFLSP